MDEYVRFARVYDLLVGPFLKPIHRAMLVTLNAVQCHKMIDLCCGTGRMAGMAAEAGMAVVGIDLSPAMLGVARSRHPEVTFIDGDAKSLFFADGEFDAATISFSLHEKTPDIAHGIVKEAVRVVRPGGLILVADYCQPVNMQSMWTGLTISTVERLAGKSHYSNYKSYMQMGGTEAFLTRMGLVVEPVMTFLNGWAGLYVTIRQGMQSSPLW